MKVKESPPPCIELINSLKIFSCKNIKKRIISKNIHEAPPRDFYRRVIGILQEKVEKQENLFISFTSRKGFLYVELQGEVNIISQKKKQIIRILENIQMKYEVYRSIISRIMQNTAMQ
ncbi:hypothetical protein NEFER03_1875 [Nematocida sp. LUAm3]|nr:hypothetical protein NEFER03_1875 [Nematocida sp. LUAm3]KAI5173974.1 hypothetical protein NEFER02_0441 [Nematocida sp. LUAm2]KAI5177281.1 hypothetical protein NEFER01_0556 [Nematocida sp. LUAm1]